MEKLARLALASAPHRLSISPCGQLEQ